MARLADICKFQSGGTPAKGEPSYFNGNIPWITTVALNGNVIGEENAVDWITEKAITKSAAKIVPTNSIMVGTRVGVGKVAINSVPMSTSQDVVSLIGIDEHEWSKPFICKFILGKGNYLNSQARGATIKGIKIDTLAELQLPDLPLEKQLKISCTIDCVDKLISLRKQQLAKLDELVKARFVELFGDPVTNPFGWRKLTVQQAIGENIIDKPLDGNHGGKHPKTSDYVPSGIPFIMANNLVEGKVDLENCAFISRKQADSLDKGFAKAGDVLITHKGTIGKTAILHCSYPYIMLTPQVTYYRPKIGIIPEYLKAYFDTDYFQGIIGNIASVGSTRAYIGITAQQELPLILPPIELQNQFAAFVEQTDKSKLAIQQSLDKLETLKKSLLQKYFG